MGRSAAGVGIALALAAGATAFAAYPDDPPDDPAFDPAEQGGQPTCLQKAGDVQQHYLYGVIPQCTPLATDPEGSAGMFIAPNRNDPSAPSAWRDYTNGNDETLIAYIEAGINWRDQPEELANKVFINRGELPDPTTPVADGVFNAEDFSDTDDANGNGLVDPEDIIVRYSDGVDDDQNGYTDDISGWDFYNDQNDPATLDSEYDHANSQMRQAASETNNGAGEAGICPDCMLLPIKGGAEALDLTDDLAESWLYAADMDVDVLVSVTADLGYSSFMEDAVEYVWDHGTVMVQASNDFNSLDHQGGMFHNHVLPGNGLVANSHGLDAVPDSAVLQNGLTTTYRARSAFTSWGSKNMFSAATTGGTTSESTPTVGGVMALVIAWGKEAAESGLIDHPLTPSEAIQVVRATSSDVAANPDPPKGWPAEPGWDLQYGYGRPNVAKAMQVISDDEIPPEAWMDGPDWYSLYDPADTDSVPVRGHVAAPRSPSYDWTLEFAPGPEPEDGEFITAATGHGTQALDGKLGKIDLGQLPESFWSAAFHLSSTKTLETNDQYDVTIRLRVTDADGRLAEERRQIAVHHDAALREGFPFRLGSGGESQPAFADLQNRGRQAVIFGDADGQVHALSPRGRELRGWPVHTLPTQVEREHAGVDPGFEPIIGNVAVGDLKGRGRQSVVATTTSGRVYVWGPKGRLKRGWPRTLDAGTKKPAVPRPDAPFTRPAIQGSSSPPVLVDLDGNSQLEIVQAGWDGRLHAWKPNGRKLAGFPVHVTLPEGTAPPSGMVAINDQKLDLPPTVAELDGDPEPELVQRTQYSFAAGAGLQVPNGGKSNVVAYNSDGSRVPGFLISGDALAFYYGSAQEFITEGVQNPSAADVDDDGRTEIASAAGIFSPTTIYNHDGSSQTTFAPLPGNVLSLAQQDPTQLLDVLNGDLPEDVPVNFTTSGAWGRFGPGGQLSYAEPGSGAATVAGSLLLAGSGLPINNYMRAFNGQSGATVPGFPAKSQGLDFLGAPLIADVTGDGDPEVIQGGDSSALHAYTSSGAQAAGFPKFQTGWVLFGPAVGDLDGNGTNELAAATREGYLMVWNTEGKPSGDEWWGYRHDERNTGRYGIDTRPPGKLRGLRMSRARHRLRFRAPGDDWYAGEADHYRVRYRYGACHDTGKACAPPPPAQNVPAAAPAGERVKLAAPARARRATVVAYDEAGNRSSRAVASIRR